MSPVRFTADGDYLDPQTRSVWDDALTVAWLHKAPRPALDNRTRLILARHRVRLASATTNRST